jgi:glycerophosphoryl diester phosphodiesterase
MTQDEFKNIQTSAKSLNLNISEYMRTASTSNIVISNNKEELTELIYQISKIGNNINQVTRHINESDFISPQQAKDIHQNHAKIIKLLKDVVESREPNRLINILKSESKLVVLVDAI